MFGYPYLKYLIELLPGDWVKQMSKINEKSVERNRLYKLGGETRLVQICF